MCPIGKTQWICLGSTRASRVTPVRLGLSAPRRNKLYHAIMSKKRSASKSSRVTRSVIDVSHWEDPIDFWGAHAPRVLVLAPRQNNLHLSMLQPFNYST